MALFNKSEKAYILLADGTVLTGQSFGAKGTVIGEVVFTTGMTGYQETLTDPSYYGQIVVQTFPLIGNYGVNKEDFETDQPKLKTIDLFAVAGVILGAIVANLLHWGIASINGMVVAAVCYCVGQAVNKRK